VSRILESEREAPAPRGGLSLHARIDKRFLIFASWPAAIVMLVITAVPFIITIALAFTNYDLIRSADWKFVGLDNFVKLIADRKTPIIILNTAYLVVVATALEVVFGLFLAILMESSIRRIGIIRSLYLIPIMTAPIVVALMWRAMFNNSSGWINYFLGLAGFAKPTWLGDPLLAMPVVIMSDLWSGVPLMAVLLFAGLLGVPRELKEAAQVDGANAWRVFLNVTLPAIRPVLLVALVLRFIDEFRKFEGIQQLTTGGPGLASTTFTLHIYEVGIHYNQIGYSAAYGLVMVLMIAGTLGLIYLVLGRNK
jgi:multiple sugar transport system permease protein